MWRFFITLSCYNCNITNLFNMTYHPLTRQEAKDLDQAQRALIFNDYIRNAFNEWYLMVNIYKYAFLNCFLPFFYPMVLYHSIKLANKTPENVYLQGNAFWPNVFALFAFVVQVYTGFNYITIKYSNGQLGETLFAISICFGLLMFLLNCACYCVQNNRFSRNKSRVLKCM